MIEETTKMSTQPVFLTTNFQVSFQFLLTGELSKNSKKELSKNSKKKRIVIFQRQSEVNSLVIRQKLAIFSKRVVFHFC